MTIHRSVARAALLLLFPVALASAEIRRFAVTLSPTAEVTAFGDSDASGFGMLTLDDRELAYQIVLSGTEAPSAAWIHRAAPGSEGENAISLGLLSMPATAAGAQGRVVLKSNLADELRNDPGAFYLNLVNPSYPGGALRGQLGAATQRFVYFPAVARAPGVNGTFFVTDLILLDRRHSGAPSDVVVDFYASNSGGLAGPTASATIQTSPGQQFVAHDLLDSLFGLTGDGALRVLAPAEVDVTARIFNDQRAVDGGTTGFLMPGADQRAASGRLPALSNASSGEIAAGIGFRTNVGYFNPQAGPATVIFRAHRTADGSLLGEAARTIPGRSRAQQAVFTLIPGVSEGERSQPDFYVTYDASPEAGLFVYAAVVDNRTGDGVYVPAILNAQSPEAAAAAPESLSGHWSGGGTGFTLDAWWVEQAGRIVGFNRVNAVNSFTGTAFVTGEVSGSNVVLHGLGLEPDSNDGSCIDEVVFTGTLSGGTEIRGKYEEGGTCYPGDSGSFALKKQ